MKNSSTDNTGSNIYFQLQRKVYSKAVYTALQSSGLQAVNSTCTDKVVHTVESNKQCTVQAVFTLNEYSSWKFLKLTEINRNID